jgi:hypothetical protein
MNREGSLRVKETNPLQPQPGAESGRCQRQFAARPPSKASTAGQEWGLSQKEQEKDARYIRKASSGRVFSEEEVMVEVDLDVDV